MVDLLESSEAFFKLLIPVSGSSQQSNEAITLCEKSGS